MIPLLCSVVEPMSVDSKTRPSRLQDSGRAPPAGDVVPLRPKDHVPGQALPGEAKERSDDELMQLAAGGSDDAFALLVRRYQGQVRSYCAWRCGGVATGDDVAQEVFVELWRTRARYEPRGRFRAFLFTIVHTRALNAVLRRPREEELACDMPVQTAEVDAFLEADRARRLHQKLDLLPKKLREALLLRFSAGLGYVEMAQVLRRSQSTVRSRVFYGITRLRELVGNEDDL